MVFYFCLNYTLTTPPLFYDDPLLTSLLVRGLPEHKWWFLRRAIKSTNNTIFSCRQIGNGLLVDDRRDNDCGVVLQSWPAWLLTGGTHTVVVWQTINWINGAVFFEMFAWIPDRASFSFYHTLWQLLTEGWGTVYQRLGFESRKYNKTVYLSKFYRTYVKTV